MFLQKYYIFLNTPEHLQKAFYMTEDITRKRPTLPCVLHLRNTALNIKLLPIIWQL